LIPDETRRDEKTFWVEFHRAAPLILGALLDAVAHGLKMLPQVKLDRKPRMADFAEWVVACEGALLWKPGTFMAAYDANRLDAVETVLEDDDVAMAVRAILERQSKWEGAAGELLLAKLQAFGAVPYSPYADSPEAHRPMPRTR
jgi:hypothetical protein